MYRCEKCHSTAIIGTGWVDVNSGITMDDIEDLDSLWCESCQSPTTIYFKQEPNENEDNDDFQETDDNFIDITDVSPYDEVRNNTEGTDQ